MKEMKSEKSLQFFFPPRDILMLKSLRINWEHVTQALWKQEMKLKLLFLEKPRQQGRHAST
jgi:hypothetical protein